MKTSTPIIVGFVANLLFTTKIENAARHAGFEMQWLDGGDEEKLGERLNGRLTIILQTITQLQPVLLLFDLQNNTVPWSQWISALKTSPATKRIPILCFSPHINADQMKIAKEAGADHVLARSRFVINMLAHFNTYARLPDNDAIETE